MHKYIFEIWINDENGNPKAYSNTEVCDGDLNCREIYRKYHDEMQKEHPGIRKYTIKFFITKPVELTKQQMQDFMANLIVPAN